MANLESKRKPKWKRVEDLIQSDDWRYLGSYPRHQIVHVLKQYRNWGFETEVIVEEATYWRPIHYTVYVRDKES